MSNCIIYRRLPSRFTPLQSVSCFTSEAAWVLDCNRRNSAGARNAAWVLPPPNPTDQSRTIPKTKRSRKLRNLRRCRISEAKRTRILLCGKMSPSLETCISMLRKAAPRLDGRSYKGQAGKIAVIGGSLEYTGAPYFTAISAMRGGAELSFVYCAASAAPAIKAYSPDLIVYPGFEYLGSECESLSRMHALVLGPGLGRGKDSAAVVEKVVTYAIEKNKILVLDADALWFVSQEEQLRKCIRQAPTYFKAFMTPNKIELDRLQIALNVDDGESVVSWFQGHVILVQKGLLDRVIGDMCTVEVSNSGSMKRVGGQGDLLAGLLALFASWMVNTSASRLAEGSELGPVAAGACACFLTRSAAKRAFLQHGRSLVASDIPTYIGPIVDEVLSDLAT